jgi:hypothetical protein
MAAWNIAVDTTIAGINRCSTAWLIFPLTAGLGCGGKWIVAAIVLGFSFQMVLIPTCRALARLRMLEVE